MIEDDIYRSSTQYRHWSFTSAQLVEQRTATNELAAAKIRASFARSKSSNGLAKNGNTDTGDSTPSSMADDIETLTVDEELKIVEWGCGKIAEMGQALNTPKDLIATAKQYLRRFYLTNSPMTYHPKSIIACALFLATKAEHFYVSLRKFTEETNVTEDDVKAPEFLLLQGIKFTLDVRHPFRGLDGGWLEVKGLLEENSMAGIEEKRAAEAWGRAKEVLRREAQMTDVYFLFTPSQIWMAAVWMVDQEVLRAYLSAKFDMLRDLGTVPSDQLSNLQDKVLTTVGRCSDILKSYKSPEDDKKERKELARIGKKLAKCQDPEKVDIVAVARAKRAEKREGSESEREEKAKKRKREQEKLKRDGDVFGGELRDAHPR